MADFPYVLFSRTILTGLKRQKDEDFVKGQAIKNQKVCLTLRL